MAEYNNASQILVLSYSLVFASATESARTLKLDRHYVRKTDIYCGGSTIFRAPSADNRVYLKIFTIRTLDFLGLFDFVDSRSVPFEPNTTQQGCSQGTSYPSVGRRAC